MKAVAAMSLNRVIGRDGTLPWHLPEDFRWFKQLTSGHLVVMGRKTFDSLPKALPGRVNIVLTRTPAELAADPAFQEKCAGPLVVDGWLDRLRTLPAPPTPMEREVWLIPSGELLRTALAEHPPTREVFIIGGAQIYADFLPHCTDVFLTQVLREVEGDAFFPQFEEAFTLADVPLRTDDFEVRHFVRK